MPDPGSRPHCPDRKKIEHQVRARLARVRVVPADFPDTAFLTERWKHLVPERVTADVRQLGDLRKSLGANTIRRNSVFHGDAVLEHRPEHDSLGERESILDVGNFPDPFRRGRSGPESP
jgi:hypothetical protein